MRGTWQLDQISDIVVDGGGNFGSRRPYTVMEMFRSTVTKRKDAPALTFMRNGEWHTYSWQTYSDKSMQFAKTLVHFGLDKHECVNVIGHNSPEWFIADVGTIAAGGVLSGIYTTNGPDACKYVSQHCGAKVVVVQNRVQLNKYLTIAEELPRLKAIVMWENSVPTDVQCPVPIYSFDEFLTIGQDVDDAVIEARIAAQLPGHCCTLIYTSGTTGPPKAVMISHDNLTWESASILHMLKDVLIDVNENNRGVSFLPLSHVAAQVIDIHVPMNLGCEVFFMNEDAMQGKLVEYLCHIRPTFMFGVPRVWEKIMEAMQEMSYKSGALSKLVMSFARSAGAVKTEHAQYGSDGYNPLNYRLVERVVLNRVQYALGLDDCKYCLTGAAPVSTDVLEFFGSLGIPLYELFGQSEGTGPHTLNIPGHWKIGSIGIPLPGSRTRIDQVTGELQYSGRHIFMGYLGDEEGTKKALDDGWLASGDIAEFDDDGFLHITGRIKELIITAGGENVPPVLIEDLLKSELPALSSIMLIGDKRKFLTFICTFREEPDGRLDSAALRIAQEIGSTATTVEQACHCDKFRQYICDGMARANEKATSRAQRVQKFTILPRDFSIAGGELTPTVKVKRSEVIKKYAAEIEAMYAT